MPTASVKNHRWGTFPGTDALDRPMAEPGHLPAAAMSLRDRNRALVLSALRRHGPSAHTALSAWSGLSSATVSAITAELIGEGVLERMDKEASASRGRPRVILRPRANFAYLAIVRLTFEQIEFSLADYAGTLRDRFSRARFSEETVADFTQSLRAGISRLLERSNVPADHLSRISLTTKGLVARHSPELIWSPAFGGERIDFVAALSPWPGAEIVLTHESRFTARAVAEAACRLAPVSPETRFAALSLDHGIGLGVAQFGTDGAIMSYAPPFGHMIHLPEGPVCRCGARGCLEAYAGFYGILRTAFDAPPDHIPAKFIPLAQMEQLADKARKGDRMAQYGFRLAGEALGIGLSRLFSFLGTMPVTVTGAGLQFFDLLEPGLAKFIASDLQARLEREPELRSAENEANLTYEGNLSASLAEMDMRVAAGRSLEVSR